MLTLGPSQQRCVREGRGLLSAHKERGPQSMKSTGASTAWGRGQPLSGSAWPEWVSAPCPAQRGSQGPPPVGRQSGAGRQSAWCPAHTSVSRMTPGAQLHTGRWEGSVVAPCVLSGAPIPGSWTVRNWAAEQGAGSGQASEALHSCPSRPHLSLEKPSSVRQSLRPKTLGPPI